MSVETIALPARDAVTRSHGPLRFRHSFTHKPHTAGNANVIELPVIGSALPHDRSSSGYAVPAHWVREFVRLAARHGWEARTVWPPLGAAVVSLDQPCPGVTKASMSTILRRLRTATDDEFLGVAPNPVSSDTLRILGFAISGAATLADALDRAEQFAPMFAGLPRPTVSTTAEYTRVSFALDGFDNTVSLVSAAVLGVTQRLIDWATRSRIHWHRVEVPYPRPYGETDHDVIFGAPVRFDAPSASLVLSATALSTPLLRSQDEVEQLLADPYPVLLSEFGIHTTYTQRVRSIIESSLGDHVCSADEIAASIGISRQTLRRRLQEEDTSVSAIRDEVLRTAAVDSVSRGGETIAALANRLGFSEPSAFTRAFRRWTGASPTAFQRRLAASGS